MTDNSRTDLAEELLAAARSAGPYMARPGNERGIVVCAGGPVMIVNAYVLVRLLREHLKSVLPIEIWHCGAVEMPRFLARQFEELGCNVVDALSTTFAGEANELQLDGWQLKAHALRFTGFEHVILLDADQVPLRDPAELFDWPHYCTTGALFWPDVIDLSITNPAWQRFGLESNQICSWESGQLCVDRKRHWLAVCLVHALNVSADVVYNMVYGDKDTFLLAWKMLGADHALVPHKPYADEYFLCQRDFSGNGLFQHRTNCKWSLHGDNIKPDGFELADVCESYLRDLRMIWNGRIFFPPGSTPGYRRLEQALVSNKTFVLSIGSKPSQVIELLDGNQIGRGRSGAMMNWYVGAGPEGAGIYICDANKETAFVMEVQSGIWSGTTFGQPPQPIELCQVEKDTGGAVRSGSAGSMVDDLISAFWNGGYHDENSAQMIATTLQGLAVVDPAIVADIGASVAKYRREDSRLACFLDELVSRLEKTSGGTASVRNYSLIFDETFYVRS
jgi:hypothetical protein